MHYQVGHADLGTHSDERAQVPRGRVDPAVPDEADEVDPIEALHRRPQDLVGRELPVLDGLVDPRQVLLDDGPGAEVQVADLRIAHLALGEPDRAPAGRKLRVRVVSPQVVEHRCGRE